MGLVVSRCFLYPPSPSPSVEYLNIDDVSVARGTTYFDISPTLIPSEATVEYKLIRKPTEEVTISGTRINNIPEKIPLGEYNITVKARGNGGYSGVTGATFKLNVVLPPPTREGCFTFSTETGTITGYTCSFVEVVIPASIRGVAVRIIGLRALKFKGLTSVYIPNSVELIERAAFHSNSLTSVYIPDSVTKIVIHAFGRNNITSASIKYGTQYTPPGAGGGVSFGLSCNVGCITIRP